MGQNFQTVNATPGGTQNKLNLNAAAVIKAAPGTIMRLIVEVIGTANALIINDCTTVGAAAAGNQIGTWAFGHALIATAGSILLIEARCAAGIVISAVPTNFVYSVFYF